MPPQSPEDDRRCDGHPDCDPGTDEPRVAEETSDTCEGSARGEERQAAADQQRKRAGCQQEQARPSTDKHARAMRVVVLIAAHRLFLSQLSVSPSIVCVRVHAQHDRSDGSVVKALAAIRMPSAMVR